MVLEDRELVTGMFSTATITLGSVVNADLRAEWWVMTGAPVISPEACPALVLNCCLPAPLKERKYGCCVIVTLCVSEKMREFNSCCKYRKLPFLNQILMTIEN